MLELVKSVGASCATLARSVRGVNPLRSMLHIQSTPHILVTVPKPYKHSEGLSTHKQNEARKRTSYSEAGGSTPVDEVTKEEVVGLGRHSMRVEDAHECLQVPVQVPNADDGLGQVAEQRGLLLELLPARRQRMQRYRMIGKGAFSEGM